MWKSRRQNRQCRCVVIPYQFRSVSILAYRRSRVRCSTLCRNPLSIQVCFNGTAKRFDWPSRKIVVIPYQFRSVSIWHCCGGCRTASSCRNPLSIQVCFNTAIDTLSKLSSGRNPLSIQVCFNTAEEFENENKLLGRNPLSIQVCFNTHALLQMGLQKGLVVIPYQFRSVSMMRLWATNIFHSYRRNPLSIQVCFNPLVGRFSLLWIILSRNPLSIQVCFNGQTRLQTKKYLKLS